MVLSTPRRRRHDRSCWAEVLDAHLFEQIAELRAVTTMWLQI